MIVGEKLKGKRQAAPVREAFSISRSLEFLSETELTKQIGYERRLWLLAILKELLDNAIDHCEEIGRLPEIVVKITGHSLSVWDNGDGIPPETVKAMLDFNSRVSSREAYRGITRGAMGNAGKCIIGAPYVLSQKHGKAVIIAKGVRHDIAVRLNALDQTPSVDYSPKKVQSDDLFGSWYPCTLAGDGEPKGTFARVVYGRYPSTLTDGQVERFVLFCRKYAALNPHLMLTLKLPSGKKVWARTTDVCGKWTAAEAEPPGWHDLDSFNRLVGACISKDRSQGRDRLLRDFVRQFSGLKRSATLAAVFDDTGLHRTTLSSLANGSDLDRHRTTKLLKAMQKHGKTPRPDKIGCIGKDHIAASFSPCDPSQVKYKKIVGEDVRGLPFVVEAAFAETGEDCVVITGCNFSPSVDQPVARLLDWILEQQKIDDDSQVALLLHVAAVDPIYLDRGKSVIDTEGALGDAIEKCVVSVTDGYRKKRKREEQDEAALDRWRDRESRRRRPQERNLNAAIFEILEEAVAEASTNGACSFSDRDLYYAARPLVQKHTKRPLSQKYFDKVVDQWEVRNGLIDGRERDARGFLLEPHTGKRIPLGTKNVDDYVIPLHLYDTILFVEKKGLLSRFQFGKIPEKYDCAIIAAEGYAPKAHKALIQAAQHGHKMKVLCFHDADPYGYNIARTLSQDTGAHRYAIEIIDAGLRLDEALKMGLAVETFERKNAFPKGVKFNKVDLEYFSGEPRRYQSKSGKLRFKHVNCKRVELNALSANPQAFVAWVESKLQDHGVAKKLVPPSKVIESRAEEELTKALEDRVRDRFEAAINLDSSVDSAVEKLLPLLDVSGAVDAVTKWASEVKPKPWTTCVDGYVRQAVFGLDAKICQHVEESLKQT